MGIPLSRIYELTKIDMWFLKQYEELHYFKELKFLIIQIESITHEICS